MKLVVSTSFCDLRVMKNLEFVRYSAVLLGLVVLCTKAQNGFCLMCTKECHMVLTHSKPFWGQFWGQICETDSRTLQSNKCAALVPLRNADTNITRFSHRKSPTNRYISFTLRQEVVRKHYSTQSPHTASVAARNASVFVDVRAANRIYSLPCDTRKKAKSTKIKQTAIRQVRKLNPPCGGFSVCPVKSGKLYFV